MISLLPSFDMISVPVPLRVTAPLMFSSVPKLPWSSIWNVPFLVIVPCQSSAWFVFNWKMDPVAMVTPFNVLVLKQQLSWIVPVPLVVKVPPVMVVPFVGPLCKTTLEPGSAWIVPPVFEIVPPASSRVAPFVASSVLVLMNVWPVLLVMMKGVAWLALIVAWLVKVLPAPIPPIPPIPPAPWMVILLVSEAPGPGWDGPIM